MARIYRHQYSGGRKSSKWYIAYRTHAGKLKRVPGFTCKKLTMQKAAELELRTERILAGVLTPSEAEPGRSIDRLLIEWERHMLGKGDGKQHATEYRRCVERVAVACSWSRIGEMEAHPAQTWLEQQMQPSEDGRPGRTGKWYMWVRSAMLAWGYWLADKRKLIPTNPFTAIDPRNVSLNRKITRRALTDAEFVKLLRATKLGEDSKGLTGEQREYLYIVAAYTGLRASALAGLTPGSFTLDDPAHVDAAASLQKNRKPLRIPIAPDVAARLKRWFRGKPADGLLWPGRRWTGDCSRMIAADLAAAGIERRTKDGQFDFHALRHQFGTMLVRAGATPAEVQQLMDHCTPALSARYFAHLRTEELAVPISRLPKLKR